MVVVATASNSPFDRGWRLGSEVQAPVAEVRLRRRKLVDDRVSKWPIPRSFVWIDQTTSNTGR